jgi:Cu(I)/Ag(I) efflux system protein CusF
MKLLATAFAVSITLLLSLSASAQTDHSAHHDGGSATNAPIAMVKGVVQRVDKTTGSVTIAHEALTNLGMPAMTMTFLVTNRTWLDPLKEGSRIKFVAENVNGALTVVALQPVK